MDNPNRYDDDRYTSASNDLVSGVEEMWESGASLADIENALQDGLRSALGKRVSVEIGVEP